MDEQAASQTLASQVAADPSAQTNQPSHAVDLLQYWKSGAHEIKTFRGHSQGVWTVAYAPNGETLASGGMDRLVRIWDIETGRMLKALRGHTRDIRQAAYSADGQILATASEDRTIRLWNPTTGDTIKLLFTRYDHSVCSISFSPDGLMLARAGHNKDIKIWEVTTGTELMTLLGKDQYDLQWSVCVAFAPDGIHLASGNDIGKIKLWEVLPSGEEKVFRVGHWKDDTEDEATEGRGFFVDDQGTFQRPMRYWIGALAFTPDSQLLISGSRDSTIKFFDMPELNEVRTLKGHSAWIRALVVSPDGKILASASDDHTIKLWDIQSGRQFRTLKGHTGPVRGIAFSPDGLRLASASWDRTIKLWEGGEAPTLE